MQKVALSFCLLVLFSVTLIKASVPQWVYLFWASLSICAALLIGTLTRTTQSPDDSLTQETKYAYLLFALFQAWAFIQTVSGVTFNLTISNEHLLLGMGFCAFLFTLNLTLKVSASHRKLILRSVLCFAVLQALYGNAVYFSQANKLLWMDKLFYLDRPTGTFVNPNHFAAFLSLALILGLSWLASIYPKTRKTGGNTPINVEALLTLFACAVLAATILLSKSIGVIGALAIVFVVYLAINRKRIFNIRTTIAYVLLSLILIGAVLSLDYGLIEQEVIGISHTVNRRIALSTTSWRMVQEHWLLGVGGGAFHSVFSQYRDLSVGNTYYNYAHNDYLQFWAEYGLIGIVLLASFVVMALKQNLLVLRFSTSPACRAFAHCSLYATLLLAIHSLVDFDMHIPGFAVSYLCILCVNFSYAPKTDPTKLPMQDRRNV